MIEDMHTYRYRNMHSDIRRHKWAHIIRCIHIHTGSDSDVEYINTRPVSHAGRSHAPVAVRVGRLHAGDRLRDCSGFAAEERMGGQQRRQIRPT